MQKAILLFLLLFFKLASFGQETMSWTVSHNKTILLTAHGEHPKTNIVHIKRQWLQQDYPWLINLSQSAHDFDPKEWKRVFGVFDESDKELLRKEDTTTLTLSGRDVKSWLGTKKEFFIYTWSIPKDPALAAQIRIRRVHLCTFTVE
jgi:hypothetical protein